MLFSRSVQAKVAVVIILVLSASVGVSIYITVSNQRTAFLDETSRGLASTSTIVNTVIRNTMLVGEAPVAIRTIRDIQGIGDFQEITLYRRDGTTAFRDTETIEDVNTRLGRIAFEPTERVPEAMIENPNFQRVVATNRPVLTESVEEQRVDYFFPVLNYAECRVCHGTDEFIRGVAYFQVSTARVFGQITETRNTLSFFFTVTGIVLAAVIVFLMRRIVLQPLLLLRGTVAEVGKGNLDVQATVRSRDEFSDFAGSINTMIAGLKDRERLEIQNRVVEARNEENRKYLDNINEGLLLLDRNQVISEQYSSFLEELFGTDTIAGRRFSEFLFPSDEDGSEQRREVEQFVELVFGNVTTDMEMLASINPLADQHLVIREGDSQREIVVDASFQRIMENGTIQNVMVIFVDKTELVQAEKALERERERSATEQEQIAAILRSGPEAFQGFIGDARRILERVEQHADLAGGAETLGALFRDLHSLKGSARYMELRNFAHALHELEEIVGAVRDGTRHPGESLTSLVRERLGELVEGVADIERINDRFKEFAKHDDAQRDFARSVPGFLENVKRMALSLAADLGKEVKIETNTDFEHLPELGQLRDPIIHLVRNAIDHGIEENLERISINKPETGTITISILRENDNSCRIEIRDDGRGIDFDAVARKAERLGLLTGENPTRNQILKAMFHPTFSSREKATEVSGRGVGLDAVQNAVHTLRGSMAVATKASAGSRFTIRIPLSGGAT